MKPMKVTAIGGASNAAIAFRTFAAAQGATIRSVVRRPIQGRPGEEIAVVEDYASIAPDLLKGSDAVVNFVGVSQGSDLLMRQLNAELPVQLARHASAAGVPHFIHISSLSVYGGAADIGPATPAAPLSAYGRSKLAGDMALSSMSEDIDVTLMRVPILYNAGTRGKLHQLASMMQRLNSFPVPGVLQPRSVLHLDNLAAVLYTVAQERLTGIRFAADPQPFTIAELAHAIEEKAGRRPVLAALPAPVFALLRRLKPDLYASLYGRSLIDPSSCIKPETGHPRSLRQGLRDLLP